MQSTLQPDPLMPVNDLDSFLSDQMQEVFLTPDYICIAMEYASSGNLFNYVKQAVRLKEAAARCAKTWRSHKLKSA
jgi:hypothetical protein